MIKNAFAQYDLSPHCTDYYFIGNKERQIKETLIVQRIVNSGIMKQCQCALENLFRDRI